MRYRDRGVVALGLGGLEAQYPPEQYAEAFAIARAGGLASVPHAGEVAGPASVRGALDALQADRIRHGVRSVEDPGLLRELADRQIVCDVCDLEDEHAAARSLGADPRALFEAGLLGALCEPEVKQALRAVADAHDWDAEAAGAGTA